MLFLYLGLSMSLLEGPAERSSGQYNFNPHKQAL